MSKKSHAQQLKKFETFLAGESQDFDVVALDPQLFATAGQRIADGFTIESAGGHGTLKHLGPVLKMSEAKPYWDKASPILGSSQPGWL